jgi:DNA-binding response OmpR family regulator
MRTKPTILVIDDSADAREILCTLLEEKGYRPLAAADGPEGIALARAEKPDCILLDIMMPDMSGYRVCEDMRSDPALEQTPIIILTARKVERDKSYARTVGADDFLTKPVRPAQLLATIKKHTEGAGRRATRQLGMRHVVALTGDQAFARLLSSAVDAFNFLRKSGTRFDVATAPTFHEAQALIDKSVPAAIIVDAGAQRERPDQIVRQLKKHPEHKDLPLLVVRHDKSEDLRFAWADARLPGRPSMKTIVAAVAKLVEG